CPNKRGGDGNGARGGYWSRLASCTAEDVGNEGEPKIIRASQGSNRRISNVEGEDRAEGQSIGRPVPAYACFASDPEGRVPRTGDGEGSGVCNQMCSCRSLIDGDVRQVRSTVELEVLHVRRSGQHEAIRVGQTH